MSKYSSRHRPDTPPRNRDVHPVMRGIGCIMMVVVPIIAYGVSILLVNSSILPLPPEITRPIIFPGWLHSLNGISSVLNYIEHQPLMIAYLLFTIVVTILIFGVMAIVYGYIYKMFGPSQYGPTDEPPIRKKVKKYTR